MPWDLLYYGAMALIFIGIIAASRKAQRAKQDAAPGGGSPPGTGESGRED